MLSVIICEPEDDQAPVSRGDKYMRSQHFQCRVRGGDCGKQLDRSVKDISHASRWERKLLRY